MKCSWGMRFFKMLVPVGEHMLRAHVNARRESRYPQTSQNEYQMFCAQVKLDFGVLRAVVTPYCGTRD